MGKSDILPSPRRDLAPRPSFQPCLFSSIYLPVGHKQTQPDSSTAAQADVQPGNRTLAIPRAHPRLSLDSEAGGGMLSLPQEAVLTRSSALPQADFEDPHPLLELSLFLIDPRQGKSRWYEGQFCHLNC